MAVDVPGGVPGGDAPPLAVRDRVSRPKDLFDDRATPHLRLGSIVEVYGDAPNGRGAHHVLYAVHWDDTGTTERGYLRVGLTKVLDAAEAEATLGQAAPRFRSIPGVQDVARVPPLRARET